MAAGVAVTGFGLMAAWAEQAPVGAPLAPGLAVLLPVFALPAPDTSSYLIFGVVAALNVAVWALLLYSVLAVASRLLGWR